MLERANIPLSLYVHFPWCERKCPYCDFNSHELRGEIDEAQYIDLLVADLREDITKYNETRPISSVFLGGGTPSLFSAAAMEELLGRARELVRLCDDVEITLEANPGSSEVDKFSAFRKAGINRLSIGIQSFDDASLRKIGRVHNGKQSIAAANSAIDAGFENFNLDLMFGLPDQSIEQASRDLETALNLKPKHLSCYQLTFEPNTLFYKQRPARLDDDGLWDMQSALQTQLASAGFEQYEVSAYASDAGYSQHNLNYWSYGDYLGVGAGAHAKITTVDGQIERTWKYKHPKQYQRGAEKNSFVGGQEFVETDLATFEFMLNGLRLKQGVSLSQFETRTGTARQRLITDTQSFVEQGLIEINGDMISASEQGYRFLDTLLESLLPNS